MAKTVGTTVATIVGIDLLEIHEIPKPNHKQYSQQIGKGLIPPGVTHTGIVSIVFQDTRSTLLVNQGVHIIVKHIEIGKLKLLFGCGVIFTTQFKGDYMIFDGK